jgi:probable HAF family extracellular repeat protein
VDFEAFRWTAPGGMVGLGYLPGGGGLAARSEANDVSSDGGVVVGHSSSSVGDQAFRWTSATGMVGIGRLPGSESSGARGVSADGNVVVGVSFANFGQSLSGFRWTAPRGMVPLAPLAGDSFSEARDVSADGHVTVGSSGINNRDRNAVFWVGEGAPRPLGPIAPSGGTAVARDALAVSGDGSVIVGAGDGGPFLWDAARGARDLKTALVNEYGLDLTGWTLTTAWDVSADGTTIVGVGVNRFGATEGWVAVLPEPSMAGAALLTCCTGALWRRRR